MPDNEPFNEIFEQLSYEAQLSFAFAVADATLTHVRNDFSDEEKRALLTFVESLFTRIGKTRRELMDIAPLVMDLDVLLELYYSEHSEVVDKKSLLTFFERKLKQQTVIGVPILNNFIVGHLHRKLNSRHTHAFLILLNQFRKLVAEIANIQPAIVDVEKVDLNNFASVNFTLTRFDTTHMVECDVEGLRVTQNLTSLGAFGDRTNVVVSSIDFSSEIDKDKFEIPERSVLIDGWGKFIFPSAWIEGIESSSNSQNALQGLIEKIELYVDEIVSVQLELKQKCDNLLNDLNVQRRLMNITFDIDLTSTDEFYGRRITFASLAFRLRTMHANLVTYFGMEDAQIKDVKITMCVEDSVHVIDSTLFINLSCRTSVTVEKNLAFIRKVAEKFSLSGLVIKQNK